MARLSTHLEFRRISNVVPRDSDLSRTVHQFPILSSFHLLLWGKGRGQSLSLEEITHLQSRLFAFPRSNVGRRKEKRGRGRARERVLVKRWRGENGGGSLSPVDRDPRRSTRTLALPVVLLRHAAFA